MASKCLITYGGSNVVGSFDEPWSRQDLLSHLSENQMFKDVDECALELTIYDEDFDTLVDITADSVIHNKARIKINEKSQVRIADVLEKGPPYSPQQARPGHVYMLPAVPQDIIMSTDRHRAGQHFKNRLRVLQWLYHDLCLQTMYPAKLYAEAARALIAKFPNLADSAGTGYAAAMEDGEDKDTIDAHLVAMAKEVSKARPDVNYTSDCMARTFASRRKWIGENPSVADIVKEYPALSMSTIDPTVVHYLPTITFEGALLDTKSFAVCLEELRIEEDSLLATIATLLALYWAFNIVFGKKGQKSLDLLCRLNEVGSGIPATPLVRVSHSLLAK
ncbi:hypothetical protein HPB49_007455 [Dermacentor silvarum]|uniref:Uncharacterized protein n=1 Tax=Dermacentor silvarum TaxID=543639 RepID=A0ACB8DXX8_DERSI|nr:hypothetical protein HPB49_007455 [Dermacentor silvarum]